MSTVDTLLTTDIRRFLAISLLVSSMLLLAGSDALASDVFDTKCAGCHTIGGGAMVGPDLAPSSKWSTADLQKSIKAMEKNVGPLTDEEVDALVIFIKTPSASTTAQAATSNTNQSTNTNATPNSNAVSNSNTAETFSNGNASKSLTTDTLEAGEPSSGAKLFNGQQALKNGGLSCIACHQVAGKGGNMGPDLTTIATRIPPKALIKACENTPYKVMKAAYREHQITHQEALDLNAYLEKIKDNKGSTRELPVPLYSSAIAALLLGVMAIGYRNRNTSVRNKLKRRN